MPFTLSKQRATENFVLKIGDIKGIKITEKAHMAKRARNRTTLIKGHPASQEFPLQKKSLREREYHDILFFHWIQTFNVLNADKAAIHL